MSGDPLDGNALVLAAAKASVSGEQLPKLVDDAQSRLADRRDAYRRRYECVHDDDDRTVFLVEEGHWQTLGDEWGLDDRAWRALRRAHREQLGQLAGDLDRRQEFDAALELREVVVIGTEQSVPG